MEITDPSVISSMVVAHWMQFVWLILLIIGTEIFAGGKPVTRNPAVMLAACGLVLTESLFVVLTEFHEPLRTQFYPPPSYFLAWVPTLRNELIWWPAPVIFFSVASSWVLAFWDWKKAPLTTSLRILAFVLIFICALEQRARIQSTADGIVMIYEREIERANQEVLAAEVPATIFALAQMQEGNGLAGEHWILGFGEESLWRTDIQVPTPGFMEKLAAAGVRAKPIWQFHSAFFLPKGMPLVLLRHMEELPGGLIGIRLEIFPDGRRVAWGERSRPSIELDLKVQDNGAGFQILPSP